MATAVAAGAALHFYLKTEAGKTAADRLKMRTPVLSEIWTKYQVAQMSRLLSTLLSGGISLMSGGTADLAGGTLTVTLLRSGPSPTLRGP